MRLSYGEIESLRAEAYSRAVEAAFVGNFDINGDIFNIRKEQTLADLVADAISEKYKQNILFALNKDE